MHSIRVKIAAITLAAILTSMLAVFAASYANMRIENDRRSVETMNLLAQNTQNALEKYTEDIEQAVEMVANVAGDRLDGATLVEYGAAGTYAGHIERTPEQSRQLDAYLSDFCADIQEAFQSVARHTQGVAAYYLCLSPDVSPSQHGFFYAKVGRTGFDAREPLDASRLNPEDSEASAWYFTSIERGRPSWIGLYRNPWLNDQWTDSYVVPIYKAGNFIGVLGMDIPLDTLIEQVRPIRVYQSGFACLFDGEGSVVYHPELPMGSQMEALELSNVSETPAGDGSGDRLIRYSTHGIERQMAYAPLSNGMILVIAAPVAEVNASWTRLVRLILPVAAAIIVFFAVVLLFVLKFATAPLQKLTEASRRLADGDYSVALDYHSQDEVGQLTSAFVRMRDRQKAYIQDLNRQIYTDALTGLPNMRYFFRLAHDRRDEIRDAGGHSVMLYFDLTDMKHYNRQYGFEAGDRLLCELAGILSRHYGPQGVCRYGDDHFAAVSDEAHVEEELHSIFREWETTGENKRPPLRVGIYPRRLEDVDINVACDRAKYACDHCTGRYSSSFCYYSEEMLQRADKRRYVISHLDQALQEGWVQVYYQPIVRAANGRVCDEEALARWIDPVRGFLSPADFIPALEDAKLIYRLDLYVVDQVLKKLKQQAEAGMYTVSQSINLSRNDFDSCDVVEEIRRRVDDAGLPRSVLNIEITESVIGSDFEFMKTQVERFHALGFQVWMDDFGSGYSSLDVLQDIHFDLLKFDMRFMKRFGEGEESKIILTDLIRMAIDLGVDTICEGVETAEEAAFLREIGCNKLQGFYYCRPIPYEEILERNRKGIQIGFEDPAESDYYAAIGRVNLYDLTVTADKDGGRQDYFDTLPAGILELRGDEVSYVRTNQAYRDFLKQFFRFDLDAQNGGYPASPEGLAAEFMKQIRRCSTELTRIFYDGRLNDGSLAHTVLNPVGVNPKSGATAVAVAVLSIVEPDKSTSYADIARALAADYYNIYVVDLDSDRFIEYSSRVGGEELAVERHGTDFFASARRDTKVRIYEADREPFLTWFSKENILRELDAQGVFTTTYRLIDTGSPMYVTMKITRMPGGNRIIIGISIVDAQMKQREQLSGQ